MAKPKKRNIGNCLVEDCEKPAKAMNMCNTHYMQYRRGTRAEDGTLLRTLRGRAKGKICKVESCDRDVIGRGFCTKHYQQFAHGHRGLDEIGQIDLKERNLGPTKLAHEERRVRGLRSGTCRLCGAPMFHGGTGYCSKHYARFRRGQLDAEGNELRPLKRVASYEGMECLVSGCSNRPDTYGLCDRHRQQAQSGIIDWKGNKLREPRHGGPTRGKDIWTANRGYRKCRVEGHPHADQYGFVLEHRLVMEEVLDRYLDPNEVVHHRDGDRQNNSPDNLEVLLRKTHNPGKNVTKGLVNQVLSALGHNDPDALEEVLRGFKN